MSSDMTTCNQLYAYLNRSISTIFNKTENAHLEVSKASLLSDFIKNPHADKLTIAILKEENETKLYIIDSMDNRSISEMLQSLAIVIKSNGILTNSKPLEEQIFISEMTLNSTQYLENLDKVELLVSFVISEYFDTIVKLHRTSDVETTAHLSQSLLLIRKKINELINAFQNLHHVIRIPNFSIDVSQEIISLTDEFDGDIGKLMETHTGLVNNSTYLNSLQSIASGWVGKIREIVATKYNIAEGTAYNEINFWSSKEEALKSIKDQLQLPGVNLVLQILRYSKRFRGELSYLSGSEISNSLLEATRNRQFLETIHIERILDCSDLDQLNDDIIDIFTNLQKLRVVKYPIDRAVLFVKSIIRGILTKVSSILQSSDFMILPYDQFHILYDKSFKIFSAIEDNVNDFTLLARETLRKRSEKFMTISIEFSTLLKDRLIKINEVRNESNVLYRSAYSLGEISGFRVDIFQGGIKDSLASFTTSMCLNLSPSGAHTFEECIDAYKSNVASLEKHISSVLLKALSGSSTHFNATLDIFVKFQPLLERPMIRNSLYDYQEKLIRNFENMLGELDHSNSESTNCNSFLQLRNIPKFSSSLMWINSVRYGSNILLQDLSSVLTDDWKEYPEGRKISTHVKVILDQLNHKQLKSSEIFRNLEGDINHSKLLSIIASNGFYEIKSNLLECSDTLFREVSVLESYKYDVPLGVSSYSNQIHLFGTFGNLLGQDISNFENIVLKCSKLGMLETLLQPFTSHTLDSIVKILQLTWGDFVRPQSSSSQDCNDSTESTKLVTSFSVQVNELRKKFELLRTVRPYFVKSLGNLMTCTFDFNDIRDNIEGIQNTIDKLRSGGFLLMDQFIHFLNLTIGSMLSERCIRKFEPLLSDATDTEYLMDHKLVLRDGKLFTVPDIDISRIGLLDEVNEWIQTVISQELITPNQTVNRETFASNLISIFPIYSSVLNHFTELFDRINKFIVKWESIETLLEIPFIKLDPLKDEQSFYFWMKISRMVGDGKLLIDSAESSVILYPIKLDYSDIRNSMEIRFHSLQNQTVEQLGDKLQKLLLKKNKDILVRITGFQESIKSENNSISFNTCARLYESIQYLEELKPVLNDYREANDFLIRMNFEIPQHWIFIDEFINNYKSLKILVGKLNSTIQKNIELLKDNISHQTESFGAQITKITKDWNELRTKMNKLNAPSASRNIENFSKTLSKTLSTGQDLSKACQYLSISWSIPYDLKSLKTQVKNCNDFWKLVRSVGEELKKVLSTNWSTISLKSLKSSLTNINSKISSIPSGFGTLSLYQDVVRTSANIDKALPILGLLRMSCIGQSHWDEIFHVLNGSKAPSPLTLGDVIHIEPFQHRKFLRKMIDQAKKEKELLSTLDSIRKYWKPDIFVLSQVRGKYIVIKNWKFVLNKLDEDIDVLKTMKLSIYGDKYETLLSDLASELGQLKGIFSIWLTAQRDWIYLFDIFKSNPEIGKQLPGESSRLSSLTADLQLHISSVIRELGSSLFSLGKKGFGKYLDRSHEMLESVKFSLIGYLDRERQSFARFYFVGNDDLLEIVGNPHNISIISKHINKMYPGIASFQSNIETGFISGIISPEGEVVTLESPLNVNGFSSASEWLQIFDMKLKATLHALISPCLSSFEELLLQLTKNNISKWIKTYPNQLLLLSIQLKWTAEVENYIGEKPKMELFLAKYKSNLSLLSEMIFDELDLLRRTKVENLIIELLHEINVLEKIIQSDKDVTNYWIKEQKYFFDTKEPKFMKSVTIKLGNSEMLYGFEYLGCPKKLVHTQLVNTAFNSMVEALRQHHGAALLGPAGTGKTETIKALGQNLGRVVLVFCCDETFDYRSITRILIGICRLGFWGCFDEFNRLQEAMLSAMSMHIEKVEESLGSSTAENIQLLGKTFKVDRNTGIFITGNPGYAGRAELPDNIKSKYKTFDVVQPDSVAISHSILLSQGFSNSKYLSTKAVSIFRDLKQRCSKQQHYDFGLRALKVVLIEAGKRRRASTIFDASSERNAEAGIVLSSLRDVVLPRLTTDDARIFNDSIKMLQGAIVHADDHSQLFNVLAQNFNGTKLELSERWKYKCAQLDQIVQLHQGFIILGSSGSGKTIMLHSLIKAISAISESEYAIHTIDAKVLSKNVIYGYLNYATNNWTDGIITRIIRNSNTSDSKQDKNIWIIFDGDIDPDWVEYLNSVLDDNKILTLPNGERLPVPNNIRIAFEVDNIHHATPATISRCGLLLLSENLFSLGGYYTHLLEMFKHKQIESEDAYDLLLANGALSVQDLRDQFISHLQAFLTVDMIQKVFKLSESYSRTMDVCFQSILSTLLSLFSQKFYEYVEFLVNHMEFCHRDNQSLVCRLTIWCLLWAFSGENALIDRNNFCTKLVEIDEIASYCGDVSALDLLYSKVSFESSLWVNYNTQVVEKNLEPHQILQPDLVIPTLDTTCTTDVLVTLLNHHGNIILCGPPGSGKTMLLLSILRKSTQFELIGMNFSEASSQHLLIDTLEEHCTYKETGDGLVLEPVKSNQWAVLFCDEVNLPKPDNFGTQKVISFLRQLTTRHGFWSDRKKSWVHTERIQFVGACNPPTDPGRHTLNRRFLRLCSVLMIDYPSRKSLRQIYLTFNKALLKLLPNLSGYAEELTDSMLDVFYNYCLKFDRNVKVHYICTPRELSRWVRGLYSGVQKAENIDVEQLIRMWIFEAQRIFSDKLESFNDREWVFKMIKEAISLHFPFADLSKAFTCPILYSDWMSYSYKSVSESDLSNFVNHRLITFEEEESSQNIVLHRSMLSHLVKLDRVLKNSQGHLILVGPSGSGKHVAIRFVAWMNGYKVVSLNVSSHFKLADFDKILKDLMISAGTGGEKICFVIDESTILESSFLERLNNLLSNAEIPGIFEGDDFTALMKAVSEASQAKGQYLNTDEERSTWFKQQIAYNLHVIFTISDPYLPDAPHIISSPALFNRCVLIWMGDWNNDSLQTIAESYLADLPLANETISNQDQGEHTVLASLVNSFIEVKNLIPISWSMTASPLQFISLVKNFVSLFVKKDSEVMEYHHHIQIGLDKLRESVVHIKALQRDLAEKSAELEAKDHEAQKTLDRMLTEQNESERKEEASLEIKKVLELQNTRIKERRSVVVDRLSEVEPLIVEAQQGVKSIKKQHLTEMRSMNHPPEPIRLALESVCVFLGFNVKTWRDVQNVIRKDDFIARIIKYDGQRQFSRRIAEYMQKTYMSNPMYNFDTVNRASKACGPLLLWVQAQLRYSEILEKIEPLKEEMRKVHDSTVENKDKLIAINGMVHDLRKSIDRSKKEYTQLIRDTENIKIQMKEVEHKVSHSTQLLESLGGEKVRWQSAINEFESYQSNLVGNVLLLSLFMTFAGAYDEFSRNQLWNKWQDILRDNSISYAKRIKFAPAMTNPADLVRWKACGLPNDDLFRANTACLISETSGRYPYIIDPSGVMLDFLVKNNLPKKLVVTSFLGNEYLKELQTCIKFGGSIVITDAEHYDPAINRIISHETSLRGGRTLITIGDIEISVSADFHLYLYTKDTAAHILPFLTSRMNVLNFSFTPTSLMKHAINITLDTLRPELGKKRLDVSTANGKYREKLRNLEDDLLGLLNDSKNNILENSELMDKLTLIKKESSTIKSKIAESDSLIQELGDVSAKYESLARLYVSFSFLVSMLHTLNPIYLYSDSFCTKILKNALNESVEKSIEQAVMTFVRSFYRNIIPSILQTDHPFIGIIIYTLSMRSISSDFDKFDDALNANASVSGLKGLLNEYNTLNNQAVEEPPISPLPLEGIISSCQILILRSAENFDTSVAVNSLAKSTGHDLISYSIGSSESTQDVEKLLRPSNSSDRWIIIENIQLSKELQEIIPRALDGQSGTKVFLTCPVTSNLSNGLSKKARQVVFETGPGIKAILNQELLTKNGILRMSGDGTRNTVYFMLAWIYAIIKERIRFVPLGLNKKYELNQDDLSFAKKFVDAALGNDNIIHWESLSDFVGRIAFGGKITDKKDLHFVSQLSSNILNEEVLLGKKGLAQGGEEEITVPKDRSFSGYQKWIDKLPVMEPVEWIALPAGSDNTFRKSELEKTLREGKMFYEHILTEM